LSTPVTALTETDLWLDRWLPLLDSLSRTTPVLELGCDTGRDTVYLVAKGFKVVATDISEKALEVCARTAPTATQVHHDLRDPLPFSDRSYRVVLASLCLHYFEWQKTTEIVAEIRRCLVPGGLLFCRLNSTKDVNHGAVGDSDAASNYYAVNGRYSNRKRFFDFAAVELLFNEGWERVAVEEMTIDRYEMPKVVWEIVLRKRIENREP